MLLFGNDLQQNTARNVGAVFLVDDDEFYPLEDQAPDISQSDVAAFDGVIESSIRIFLNHSRFAHGAPRSCWPTPPEDAGSCQSTFDQILDLRLKNSAMRR